MAYANISDALRAFDEATGQREEFLVHMDRKGGWTTDTMNKFLADPLGTARSFDFKVTEKNPAPAKPATEAQQSQMSPEEEKRVSGEFFNTMKTQGFTEAQAASMTGEYISSLKNGKTALASWTEIANKYKPPSQTQTQPTQPPAQPAAQGTPDSPGAVFTPSQTPNTPAKTGEEGARAAFDSGGFSELLKFLEANKTQPAPQQQQPPAQPAQPIAEAVVKTPGQYGGYQSAGELLS